MSSAAIIIPCYNNQATVGAAIESALGQTTKNVEVIVIDDGSMDRSLEIISRYEDRVTVIKQENSGACVARNRGLEASKAAFVKFLDADDVLLPDCIRAQLESSRNLDESTVVFGKGIWVDEAGRTIRNYPEGLKDGDELSVADLVEGSPLTSCPLHRRDLLLQVGGFNPNCPRGQEHDLHIRLGIRGVRFRYKQTDCYHYVQHSSNARVSKQRFKRDVLSAQLETYLCQWKSFQQSEAVIADVAESHKAFARHLWKLGRLAAASEFDDLANMCFTHSDGIAQGRARGAIGSSIYLILARTLGGVPAERIVRATKRVARMGRA